MGAAANTFLGRLKSPNALERKLFLILVLRLTTSSKSAVATRSLRNAEDVTALLFGMTNLLSKDVKSVSQN
jgi:hypothetical protein